VKENLMLANFSALAFENAGDGAVERMVIWGTLK
jgi:hypothetical protein